MGRKEKSKKLKTFPKYKFIKEMRNREKRLIDEQDAEFFKKVLERDGSKCVICGKTRETKQTLHPMHIFPYEYELTRCDINNGLTGCARCHIYAKYAFHNNPLFFVDWIKKNRIDQYEYLMKLLPKFIEDCRIKKY